MQQTLQKFLRVIPIKSFEDNYAYLILGSIQNCGALVDPADTGVIIPFLKKYQNLNITHVLYTHKHWDHAGNCEELKKFLEQEQNQNFQGQIQFIAQKEDAEKIPVANHILNDKQNSFDVNGIKFNSYHAPCHTRGHSLYYFDSIANNFQQNLSNEDEKLIQENKTFNTEKGLFTGDTLFLGGAGRFFEGQADEMIQNMDYISSLPDDTQIFCGHEYTKSNYDWARKVETDNQELQKQYENSLVQPMTIPGNVKTEKLANVFMRCRVESLQKLLGVQNNDGVQTMTLLRSMKNNGQVLKDIQGNL